MNEHPHIGLADIERFYFPKAKHSNVKYLFFKVNSKNHLNPCFSKNTISMVDNAFIAVWKPNVVVPTTQVIKAVNKLRLIEAVLGYPYDGRSYHCD